MHVVATAGHVDHGKSTLVRALTGMEPDRWAEERRRGLTIDLGFAWTSLPSGEQIAFVDVPGHERFITNMLAGVGPAPAVMFVVAADEGWRAQSEEHLQVVDSLGVRNGLAVISKADRGDADVVASEVTARFAQSSLRDTPVVVASAQTGAGLDELRAALDVLVAGLPNPVAGAPVRLWVDRSFSLRGAGTVVTGTLQAGTIAVGQTLQLEPGSRSVVVRSLESAKEQRCDVAGVARVAVNLRGVDRDHVRRGMALVTTAGWTATTEVDVVGDVSSLPRDVVVHIGSAAVPARVRMLGERAARVRLATALPLHLRDRLLLREPATRRVVGADVADLTPTQLRGRGAAAAVAARLRLPQTADEVVGQRGFATARELRAAGMADEPAAARRVGEWWIAPDVWAGWAERLPSLVPSDADGIELEMIRRALDLPDLEIARVLVSEHRDLVFAAGRVTRIDARAEDIPALTELAKRLADRPLDAPDGDQVAEIGRAALSAGVRRGQLLHLGANVYVSPIAPDVAIERLRELPEPFSVSDARQALGVSRRVAVPLLEHLDAARKTRKLPDGTRLVVPRPG